MLNVKIQNLLVSIELIFVFTLLRIRFLKIRIYSSHFC